jgi:D-alanyl-D-alanine carboxypeptidase (penicillin-binding protein 5/6)
VPRRSLFHGALSLLFVVLSCPTPVQAATPPPTPVPPRGSPSPFPTTLQTRPPSPRPPTLQAKAAILVDLDTRQVLFAKQADVRRPVASLTKVMTALLTIEQSDPEDVVVVSPEAAPPANLVGISSLGLLPGERISVEELLYALLLQSASDAAVALAEHVSGSAAAFEREMNRRAVELGADDTRFRSPSGLNDRGYSTARDLADITDAAFGEPLFRKITRTKFHVVPASLGGKPRRIQNRNVLLWLYDGTLGGKTGFTTAAGYCVIAVAERDGRRLLSVVLGEPHEPFSDAAELLTWGFEEFRQVTFVKEGESFGSRQIGATLVPVAAASPITVLVPKRGAGHPRVVPKLTATSALDLAPGDRVGTVFVRGPRTVLGQAPLVVASSDGGAVEDGAWWGVTAAGVAMVGAAVAERFGG